MCFSLFHRGKSLGLNEHESIYIKYYIIIPNICLYPNERLVKCVNSCINSRPKKRWHMAESQLIEHLKSITTNNLTVDTYFVDLCRVTAASASREHREHPWPEANGFSRLGYITLQEHNLHLYINYNYTFTIYITN